MVWVSLLVERGIFVALVLTKEKKREEKGIYRNIQRYI